MLFKVLAVLFIATVVGRFLLRPRLKGLGRWFNRLVDVSLVVIAVVYIVQLVRLLMK